MAEWAEGFTIRREQYENFPCPYPSPRCNLSKEYGRCCSECNKKRCLERCKNEPLKCGRYEKRKAKKK